MQLIDMKNERLRNGHFGYNNSQDKIVRRNLDISYRVDLKITFWTFLRQEYRI